MAPTINPGDFAVIYKNDKPQVGDVVLFHSEGMEIIHRVIDRTEFGYLTQGDANEEPDPNTVAFSQVEGIYITRIPLIGYLLVFIKLAIQGVFS
jgi:signal peptidase